MIHNSHIPYVTSLLNQRQHQKRLTRDKKRKNKTRLESCSVVKELFLHLESLEEEKGGKETKLPKLQRDISTFSDDLESHDSWCFVKANMAFH